MASSLSAKDALRQAETEGLTMLSKYSYLTLEMPPPPAPAPRPAPVSVPVPMPVEPPLLPAACAGFASMDSAVLAASSSPPLTNSQRLPAGFPTAATTDWVQSTHPAAPIRRWTIDPKSTSTGAARRRHPTPHSTTSLTRRSPAPLLTLAGAPAKKPTPSVACCKLIHDRNGNTAFTCRYPGCDKSYASRDAVRKHCRLHHLVWLRTLERVTTHEEEVVEAELPIKTQTRSAMTAEEALRQAEAEGLTLERSLGVGANSSGYKGVAVNSSSKSKPYTAQVWRGGKLVHLGRFATAEEAALRYARTSEAQVAAPQPPAHRRVLSTVYAVPLPSAPAASSRKRKVESEEQPPDMVPADVVVILEGRFVESATFE